MHSFSGDGGGSKTVCDYTNSGQMHIFSGNFGSTRRCGQERSGQVSSFSGDDVMTKRAHTIRVRCAAPLTSTARTCVYGASLTACAASRAVAAS